MPSFSSSSRSRLAKAHPLLQDIMNEAIKQYDFTILDSQRGRADQEKAFREGKSKAHFGQSAHNWSPSVALDVAPFPIDWNDTKRFHDLAAIILNIAREKNIPLRWGGDWDMNGKPNTSGLIDLPHFELHPWREWAKKCKPYGG